MRTLGDWRSVAVEIPAMRGHVDVRVWSPPGAQDRVVVVHDGPEYDRAAGLSEFAVRAVEAGTLPPFHLALLPPGPPGERDEWYSASPAYAKGLARQVLPRLAGRSPVVGIGASLGALALLHAQRRHPAAFGALFLQSGSFFQPRYDSQESGFVRYLRIVRFVGRVLRAAEGPPAPVTMTCGAAEENLPNNRGMAEALGGQGYPVTFTETPGGHDWPSWRAALDPHLTSLLQRVWS